MHASTKPCIACYKEIDARARKCPNCLTVHPRARDRVAQAIILIAVGGVIGGIAIGVKTLSMRRFETVDTSVDVRKLQVQKTRVVVGQLRGHDNLYVVGKIKNNSSKTIASASLEVRCFNENGEMIDSWLGNWRGHVKPGNEAAFKLDSAGTHPKEDIATHHVEINHAHALHR